MFNMFNFFELYIYIYWSFSWYVPLEKNATFPFLKYPAFRGARGFSKTTQATPLLHHMFEHHFVDGLKVGDPNGAPWFWLEEAKALLLWGGGWVDLQK